MLNSLWTQIVARVVLPAQCACATCAVGDRGRLESTLLTQTATATVKADATLPLALLMAMLLLMLLLLLMVMLLLTAMLLVMLLPNEVALGRVLAEIYLCMVIVAIVVMQGSSSWWICLWVELEWERESE